MMRHVVTIWRPSTTLNSRGQISGDPSSVMADVPADVEQLAGLELIRANKVWAEARYRVRLLADPNSPITPKDYLTVVTATGEKTLHIGAVIDKDQTGTSLELLCKEHVS